MIKKLIKFFLTSSLYSLLMLGFGMAIRYFVTDSQMSLQDILFWIGAIPIALFSIGLFGNFFGRGSISYQLSRSINAQSSNQRAVQDENDTKSDVKSGMKGILAGLILWSISYFM